MLTVDFISKGGVSMRKFLVFLIAVLVVVSFAQWKPAKSITVIVPWAAGGSTDQVTRMITSQMEPLLGRKFIIVNTPGGAGSIGTLNAWQAPHDGYTWTANATLDLTKYAVLGYMNVTHRDWTYFLCAEAPNVVVVNPNTPYKTIEDLVKAMRENPEIPLSSAGTGSGGHVALEIFAEHLKLKYKHVPYAGGAPATTAVVSGEVVGNMQFIHEVADMARAGKLRILCTLASEPINLQGYGEIPSIRQWYPDFPDVRFHFGLIIPKDVPEEVLKTVGEVFEKAANSDVFKEWALKQGLRPVCYYGKEAEDIVEQVARRVTWLLYDRGIATVSPEQFGIPRIGQ
jgi:tripartite-type tricarboxylate transporter receptor subunit TctC